MPPEILPLIVNWSLPLVVVTWALLASDTFAAMVCTPVTFTGTVPVPLRVKVPVPANV